MSTSKFVIGRLPLAFINLSWLNPPPVVELRDKGNVSSMKELSEDSHGGADSRIVALSYLSVAKDRIRYRAGDFFRRVQYPWT